MKLKDEQKTIRSVKKKKKIRLLRNEKAKLVTQLRKETFDLIVARVEFSS